MALTDLSEKRATSAVDTFQGQSAITSFRSRNIGAIIIGIKDLLHVNGVDEASAALVVGQVALNLLKIPTSDFSPI